jgi:hypothetical protein
MNMSRPSHADRDSAIRTLRCADQHGVHLSLTDRDALCHLVIASMTGDRLSAVELAQARSVIARYEDLGAADAMDRGETARNLGIRRENMHVTLSRLARHGFAKILRRIGGGGEETARQREPGSASNRAVETSNKPVAVAVLAALGLAVVLPGYLLITDWAGARSGPRTDITGVAQSCGGQPGGTDSTLSDASTRHRPCTARWERTLMTVEGPGSTSGGGSAAVRKAPSFAPEKELRP